jgi:hypothetical protein
MPKITVDSRNSEVRAAVTQDGRALRHASETLQNDREIVLAAVTQDGRALRHASETLQNDREIVRAAVTQDGWALRHASETLKNDREFVLAAVTQDGRALLHASETLQNDREFVLAAVKQNVYAFEDASETLKNDREIVLAAVTQDSRALRHRALGHASETLQNDRTLLRLVNLISSDAAVQFRALEPLKTKLKQETNIERQAAAETMIADIEDAILCNHEPGHFDFEAAFNQAVNKAKPILEQQTGWKKVIDAVANIILGLFRALRGEQNRGGEQNRFSFFTNPNPVQEEIEAVQQVISPNE